MELINDSVSVLEKKVFNLIAENINRLAREKERIVLAIPGGSSVNGIFYNLKEGNISWEKVHIFMVDERLVPLNSEESNFKLAKESFIDELLGRALIYEENIHPFLYDSLNKEDCIRKYSKDLEEIGGKFDIVLLSSGEDGHVGSLYPNHPSIEDNSEFYIYVDNSPKPPPKRMSASRRLIEKSDLRLLLFFGDKKRKAYENFCDNSLGLYDCPAKIVNSVKRSYVFVGS
ncbi:6-phosphogluconolactonase [Candidatus Pacearchaeota archaeon]|nr:6-phosphogluconolactonase [Candidatus Pacearchaeota archaeon]